MSTLAPFMLAPDAKALLDTGTVPLPAAKAPPGTNGDGGEDGAAVERTVGATTAADGAAVSTAAAAAATTASARWERHKVAKHRGEG